ncbi:MAG: ABC transporter permease [Planctomycetota bacterium]|jgi:peptide/nickel transport system permease protein
MDSGAEKPQDEATGAAGGVEAHLPAEPEASPGYWKKVFRRFRRHRTGLVGLAIFVLLLLLSIFSPLLAGNQPIACSYKGKTYFPAVVDVFHKIPGGSYLYSKPKPFRFPSFDAKRQITSAKGEWAVWPWIPYGPNEVDAEIRLEPRDAKHTLGTDDVGRDVASRMIHAAAISIQVGFISMGIATLIGLFVGALAGYAGGWVDVVVSRLIEIVMCFPTFFLILSILVWLPPSIYNVMIVIGLTAWTGIARYVRAEFMRLKTLDYAIAAQALGASGFRIAFRHLLPNSLAPVLVVVTFGIAGAILTEAALSFLGFGVMPPQPSWGNILSQAYENLRTAPHLIWPPCIAIFISVLGFNLIGDAFRDVTDPKLYGS